MTKSGESVDTLINEFVAKVSIKKKLFNQSLWLLETIGSHDAANLNFELDKELRTLYSDNNLYSKLLKAKEDLSLTPLIKRQIEVLIRDIKPNLIPPDFLIELTRAESNLHISFINYRAKIDGRQVTDNEIREILKLEDNSQKRQQAWEASKSIGNNVAPQILNIVKLRNKIAHHLGYTDYFQMQLDLKEVDSEWLFNLLNDFSYKSEKAYQQAIEEIEIEQCKKFSVTKDQLGPWAWSEPFAQENPLNTKELDELVRDLDLCEIAHAFYNKMGFDVLPIFQRSDMFERPGKNQHAFFINIDRGSDLRTLNNVKCSLKWLETLLHEYGHAVYELGFENDTPWLLKTPPHMITTEAMALIAGRQAYRSKILQDIIPRTQSQPHLLVEVEKSLKRRQLIFSRWALVMIYFEKELYSNPNQDLNLLWWNLVERFQKIKTPPNRSQQHDWATKYHIGMAPVYYYSYLLGEFFASSIEETLLSELGSDYLASDKAGNFLLNKLFKPANTLRWNDLVTHITHQNLNANAWLKHFS